MKVCDISDLLGIPYKANGTDPEDGVDCLWAAHAALLRIYPELKESEFPLNKAAAMQLLLNTEADTWSKVPFAKNLGDVIFGESPEPWVAVLVDPIGRYAFTANRARGTALIYTGNLSVPNITFRRRIPPP